MRAVQPALPLKASQVVHAASLEQVCCGGAARHSHALCPRALRPGHQLQQVLIVLHRVLHGHTDQAPAVPVTHCCPKLRAGTPQSDEWVPQIEQGTAAQPGGTPPNVQQSCLQRRSPSRADTWSVGLAGIRQGSP